MSAGKGRQGLHGRLWTNKDKAVLAATLGAGVVATKVLTSRWPIGGGLAVVLVCTVAGIVLLFYAALGGKRRGVE